jgi:hypothetical protein
MSNDAGSGGAKEGFVTSSCTWGCAACTFSPSDEALLELEDPDILLAPE